MHNIILYIYVCVCVCVCCCYYLLLLLLLIILLLLLFAFRHSFLLFGRAMHAGFWYAKCIPLYIVILVLQTVSTSKTTGPYGRARSQIWSFSVHMAGHSHNFLTPFHVPQQRSCCLTCPQVDQKARYETTSSLVRLEATSPGSWERASHR